MTCARLVPVWARGLQWQLCFCALDLKVKRRTGELETRASAPPQLSSADSVELSYGAHWLSCASVAEFSGFRCSRAYEGKGVSISAGPQSCIKVSSGTPSIHSVSGIRR